MYVHEVSDVKLKARSLHYRVFYRSTAALNTTGQVTVRVINIVETEFTVQLRSVLCLHLHVGYTNALNSLLQSIRVVP